MAIVPTLFEALRDAQALELPPGTPSSGKRFEDFMVKQLCLALQEQAGLRVFPPRYTLQEPTYSGVHHQFDIIVRENSLTAAECKFRQNTGIGDLFAFKGKLADYRQPPNGIFVTTSRAINRDIFCYAIAHRIRIVCSVLPPVEYMTERVQKDSALAHRLASLSVRLESGEVPAQVFVEWSNACRRYEAEGYR